jgi:predicted nucleic acid-binding protein
LRREGEAPAEPHLRKHATFAKLDESRVFCNWYDLIVKYDVKGKLSHDARLVAAMQRHGVTNMLTFNSGDFARFPATDAFAPEDVLAGRLPV